MPEVEKRELEKAEPAAPARKRSTFELIALTWLVLLSGALGATAYFLMPSDTWFTRPLSNMPLKPAHVIGIAVGLAGLVGLRRAFAGRLEWVKPDQGRWVRIVAYLGTMAVGLFAASSMYRLPDLESRWLSTISMVKFIGKEFSLRPIFFPSAVVFLAVGTVVHFLYGKPRWADFLIETEGELRKVSWPQKREWTGSSIVVILVIATTACFLWFCDEMLTWVMQKTDLGF